MLGSMDEHGAGFLMENLPAAVAGSQPKPSSSGALMAAVADVHTAASMINRRTSEELPRSASHTRQRATVAASTATHSTGLVLTTTRRGGSLVDNQSSQQVAAWQWEGGRSPKHKAPSKDIVLQLNAELSATWRARDHVQLSFCSGEVSYELHMGQQLRRTSTYLDNSKRTARSTSGAAGRTVVSGGRMMVVDTPTLIERAGESTAVSSLLGHTSSQQVRHPELSAIMAGLEQEMKPLQRRAELAASAGQGELVALLGSTSHSSSHRGGRKLAAATAPAGGTRKDPMEDTLRSSLSMTARERPAVPWTTAGWREAAADQTRAEVPMFMRANSAAVQEAEPTPTGSAAGMVQPSTAVHSPGATMRQALAAVSDGYGGLGGAAWHNGKWIKGPEVRHKLKGRHQPLARSEAITRNSGRYNAAAEGHVPSCGPSGATRQTRLHTVPMTQLDDLIKHTNTSPEGQVAHPEQVVLVSVLREDESASRVAQSLLEHVNGTLSAMYPFSPEFQGHHSTDDDAESMAALEAAAVKAAGGKNPLGLGPSRTVAPYRILRINAAENAAWLSQRKIRTVPFFMAYKGGKLVYSGVLGGTARVRVKPVGVEANMLLALRSPSVQSATEKLLKQQGTPFTLAPPTRFDIDSGRMVGVAESVASAVAQQRQAARASQDRVKRAHRASSASRGQQAQGAERTSAPLPGTDATLQSRSNFAICLLEADLPAAEWPAVQLALSTPGGNPGVGAPSVITTTSGMRKSMLTAAHLSYGTLLVAVHARGAVPLGDGRWDTDIGLGGGQAGSFLGSGKDTGASKRKGSGALAAAKFHRRRAARERVLARSSTRGGSLGASSSSLEATQPAANELSSTFGAKSMHTRATSLVLSSAGLLSTTREERDLRAKAADPFFHPAPSSAWACPHTGIIQNPNTEHLLGGIAAVAVMLPLRAATVNALCRIYASAAASQQLQEGLAIRLPGQDDGPMGAGDEPHLGLTHNDLLARLHSMSRATHDFSGADFFSKGGGIALSSSETFVRGVQLVS